MSFSQPFENSALKEIFVKCAIALLDASVDYWKTITLLITRIFKLI